MKPTLGICLEFLPDIHNGHVLVYLDELPLLGVAIEHLEKRFVVERQGEEPVVSMRLHDEFAPLDLGDGKIETTQTRVGGIVEARRHWRFHGAAEAGAKLAKERVNKVRQARDLVFDWEECGRQIESFVHVLFPSELVASRQLALNIHS